MSLDKGLNRGQELLLLLMLLLLLLLLLPRPVRVRIHDCTLMDLEIVWAPKYLPMWCLVVCPCPWFGVGRTGKRKAP
jgi:hypothetical protein